MECQALLFPPYSARKENYTKLSIKIVVVILHDIYTRAPVTLGFTILVKLFSTYFTINLGHFGSVRCGHISSVLLALSFALLA